MCESVKTSVERVATLSAVLKGEKKTRAGGTLAHVRRGTAAESARLIVVREVVGFLL